jgi:hypothetical protein
MTGKFLAYIVPGIASNETFSRRLATFEDTFSDASFTFDRAVR